MVRNVKCAVLQFACGLDVEANVATAERLVRQAAAEGAQVILLQELFAGVYWCQEQDPVRHLEGEGRKGCRCRQMQANETWVDESEQQQGGPRRPGRHCYEGWW